jgi:DnaJ like chaperone protein
MSPRGAFRQLRAALASNGASMQWFGKGVGALIGTLLAGPIGALVGAFAGHRWDQSRLGRLFFDTTFEVMGRIAKVDGRVSEDEVRVARRIMQGMRLSEGEVLDAIERFTRGKSADYPLDARLEALAAEIGGRRDLARAFVHIQLQAAVGAGEIGAEKREVLWLVASALGIGRAELADLEAAVRGLGRKAGAEPLSLDAAYSVLGVSPRASDEEIKTAYRRLMNQHHPDKLVARGLPESMLDVAEQKTQEVRSAYERIRAQRGFK